MPYSYSIKPVALPPGRASVSTKPAPTGSATCTNTIGTARVACSSGPVVALVAAKMTSDESATNSAAYLRMRSGSPAPQRMSMRTLRPSIQPDCRQRLGDRQDAPLRCRIVCREGHEHADAPHPLALLRARRERPCRRAAEKRDEGAAPHSITSSAVASSVGGTSRPSALAVLRLRINSIFVDCCTGNRPRRPIHR